MGRVPVLTLSPTKAYDDIRDLYAKEKLKKKGICPNTFLSTWMLAVVKLVRRRLYQCRDGVYGGCSIALRNL
jgi:hypothetical protein